MIEVPSQLRRVCADVDRSALDAWWEGLDDDPRAHVARLCDERVDACFFGVVADDRDHIVPKVRGGRFVADDDASGSTSRGPAISST